MKCFISSLQTLAFLLIILCLPSCQVSPKWALESTGSGYDSRFQGAISNSQKVRPTGAYAVNSPTQGPGFGAPYGQGTYQTASAVAQPTPMMVPRHKVFVAQPLPKTVVAPNPKPQTSQKSPMPRGKVHLVNGRALAPADAPPVVRRAVEAGNRMQKFPYKWGGGHAVLNDTGYDCSGTVSYVLREAGIMPDQMTSRGFLNFGEPGEGDWITVWAKDGHVFMIIGGLRLDTGGSTTRTGPRWKSKSRNYKGFVARHPRGL